MSPRFALAGTLISALAISGGPQGRPRARRSHRRWHSDRKSTRLNSSHLVISYAVFCLKKKKIQYGARTQSEFMSNLQGQQAHHALHSCQGCASADCSGLPNPPASLPLPLTPPPPPPPP